MALHWSGKGLIALYYHMREGFGRVSAKAMQTILLRNAKTLQWRVEQLAFIRHVLEISMIATSTANVFAFVPAVITSIYAFLTLGVR